MPIIYQNVHYATHHTRAALIVGNSRPAPLDL